MFEGMVFSLTVACKNCMINLRTLETMPHSPNYMSTIQIPVRYNINDSTFADFFEWVGDNIGCPCPRIMKFMHEVMSSEDVETVLDFYSLVSLACFSFPLLSIIHRAVMLEIIRQLPGESNVSGESLHQI
jgi:hypothetical protein